MRISPIDGAIQRLVPENLRQRILKMAHYPRLAGHPGSRRMYDTLRRDFYWPNMANDVATLVRNCTSCAKVRGAKHSHQHFLKLFPAAGPLEYVAMDILGPLPKSAKGNQYILVITDRYTKLARAIPLATTTAPVVAEAFLDYWVYPYGMPNYLLTDNGTQFVSKFFETICSYLGIKHLTTTAYHPECNGQAERYNRTLVERLRHYVSEHQKQWDVYVPTLTYAYNLQTHRATNTTPFSTALSRHPPIPPVESIPSAFPTDAEDSVSAGELKKRILGRFAKALKLADGTLDKTQRRYKKYFDRRVHLAPSFQPGSWVFLNRPPARALTPAERTSNEIAGRNKLLTKAYGPFQVVASSPETVTINEYGLRNTVSNDRARPTTMPSAAIAAANSPNYDEKPLSPPETTVPEETPPDNNASPPDEQPKPTDDPLLADIDKNEPGPIDNEDHYVVEKLVAHRRKAGRTEYKVRWYGWHPRYDQFLPETEIPDHFVQQYKASVAAKKTRRNKKTRGARR